MSKKLFAIIVLSSFIAIVVPLVVHATTVTYCADPGDPTTSDPYDPDQPIINPDGSVPAALKKYLLDAGYSESSANAIMGNISIESCGYKLRVYNNSCSSLAPDDFVAYKNGAKTFSGGYGLAQWTSAGRVKNLQDHADNTIKKSVNTLDVQASFIVKELKSSSYKLTPSKLNAMTMEEVVWIIMRDYETPESLICTKSTSSNCNNEASARNISLSELLSNTTKYASAYESYSNRLTEAKNAKSVTPSEDPGTEDPGTGDDPTPTPPSTGTSGALGKQSSSGFYAQCRADYSDKSWRKTTTTICASGCSLISVANSAKYLGVTPNNPGTLADWTKTVISGESETGWNGSVKKTISHLNMKWDGSYLWSNYNTSTSSKISAIRQTLAAGGVVIAGGDREKSSNPNKKTINCEDESNKRAGLCVFSRYGHFITIIGITADDKLIVANAANGKNGTSTNDKINANNVLQFSNKAIGVYK